MVKKERVRQRCKICERSTVHELRIVDGSEFYVCLICEVNPDPASRGQSDFRDVDRTAEAERTRLWGSTPRGF
jgi:hypothetical protein